VIVRVRVEGEKTERGSKDNIKTPLPSSLFFSAGNQLGKIQKQPTIPKLLGSKSILAGVDTKSLTANTVCISFLLGIPFSQDFPNSQGFG
jgi:hypothetical protein